MSSRTSTVRGAALIAGASSLAIGMALATQALAQVAPSDQVVVTASRVERAGFTAPTPTAVQSGELLREQGLNNVNDLLEQAPAIHGSADQHTFNTNQNNLYTNPAATFVSLRNLGNGQTGSAARTLVLVDTNRFVFQSTGGAVNINAIPTIALDHVDVVTGGSSAAYGSEAVAGVINLVLKKNYEGFQIEGSGGQSTYGDDQSAHIALLGGRSFMGGKLHVLGAVDYDYNAGIGPLKGNPRPWAAGAYGIFSGFTGPNGTGTAVRYLGGDLRTSQRAYGGLITATQAFTANAPTSVTSTASTSPFHGITFDANGNPVPFQYGNLYNSPNNSTMSGGDALNKYNFNNDTAMIMLPSRRLSGLFRANYDVTDHIQALFTLNYAYNTTDHATVSPLYPNGNGIAPVNYRVGCSTPGVVASCNPFIPAATANQMIANNVQYITLGDTLSDFGPLEDHGDDTTYQANLDFKGDLNALAKNWTWDTHFAYGRVVVNTAALNMPIDANFQNALDAVTVTPANVGTSGLAVGSIACRSTLTNPSNGCLPYNPFGANRNSNNVALNKYLHAVSSRRDTTGRTDIAGNLRGEPLSTWAGPISVAVGGEYRNDSLAVTADPLSVARLFYSNNNQPYSGSISVVEGYAEAVIPLLKDMPFAKSVDFDGSVREAHYDRSGNTFSYKAGGTWTFTDDFRFRGSVSQDSRAPNVTELFTAVTPGAALINIKLPSTAFYSTDPNAANYIGKFTSTQISADTAHLVNAPGSNTIGTSVGNLNLQPEVSHTYTFGAVFSPTFNEYLRGFRASADYYNINIVNAIFTPTAQTIVSGCQNAPSAATCADINYTVVNGVFNMQENLRPQNVSSIRTSGIDIVVDYVTPLSRYWAPAPGRLAMNFTANYVDHLITVLNGVATERAGEVGGGVFTTDTDTPHWIWDANFNYQVGQFTFNAHVHYIGGGVLDLSAQPGGANAGLIRLADGTIYNTVPSLTYLNLGLQYELPKETAFGTSTQLFFNVNNVTNLSPPNWGRDPTADIIGRFYTLGFRMKL